MHFSGSFNGRIYARPFVGRISDLLSRLPVSPILISSASALARASYPCSVRPV